MKLRKEVKIVLFILIVGAISITILSMSKKTHSIKEFSPNPKEEKVILKENNIQDVQEEIKIEEPSLPIEEPKKQESHLNIEEPTKKAEKKIVEEAKEEKKIVKEQENKKEEPIKKEQPEEIKEELIEIESINFNKQTIYQEINSEKKNINEINKINIYPENATNKEIKWSSSNNDIAYIEDNNLVIKATGAITITAKSNNNKEAKYDLIIGNQIKVETYFGRTKDYTAAVPLDKLPMTIFAHVKIKGLSCSIDKKKQYDVKLKLYKDNQELPNTIQNNYLERGYSIIKTHEDQEGTYYISYYIKDNCTNYIKEGISRNITITSDMEGEGLNNMIY